MLECIKLSLNCFQNNTLDNYYLINNLQPQVMSESKEDSHEAPSPFFRAVAGYHNKLVGEKEIILADLQLMAERNTCSSKVMSKLDELSATEAKLDTLRKHFGDNNEQKPTVESPG